MRRRQRSTVFVVCIVGLFIGMSIVPIISSEITTERNNIKGKRTPFLNFQLINYDFLYQLIKSRFNPLISWRKQAMLTASDTDEWFGYSVALDGKYAIIGAIQAEKGGAVYVFKRIGRWWYEQAVLMTSDGDTMDSFGYTVALDGAYAIIGAPLDNDNGYMSGSVYVFKRIGNKWYQQAKLISSDIIKRSDLFGCSVSIDGKYALIGAKGDGMGKGAVYIFKRNGNKWHQQAKLTSKQRSSSLAVPALFSDNFGCSVAIDGAYALIGAKGDDSLNGLDAGAAYMFKRVGDKWYYQDKLAASKGLFFRHMDDYFGCSVALDGKYAIIGASAEHVDRITPAGAAYVYKRDGNKWVEQDRLIASDAKFGDGFGFSVDIDAEYALIGASDSDNFLPFAGNGAGYMFKRSGNKWFEKGKIITTHSGGFGWSVAINGDHALMGAWGDDVAFVYSLQTFFPFK